MIARQLRGGDFAQYLVASQFNEVGSVSEAKPYGSALSSSLDV